MRGDAPALLDDLLAGALQRRAADRDRARAEGAGAHGNSRGVAFHDGDALHRHAELRGENLRIRRGVALAVVMRAEIRGDAAVGSDAHLRRFVEPDLRAHHPRQAGWSDSRRFHIAGDADAAARWSFLRIT